MKVNPWIKTAIACVVVVLALGGIKFSQIRSAIAFAESFPEQSESVESAVGIAVPYTQQITVLGEAIAPQHVALYSETPGRIVKVGFASGDTVSKGQILLQQDISEELALLDAAKARLDLADSIYRRNKSLYETNAVSEEQYDTARVELATVKADIARLQSVIRKKTVTAPFDGKAGIHQFEVGQFLLDNVLVTALVGASEYLWVDFHVPQFYPILANGSTVAIKQLNNSSAAEASDWIDAEVIARSPQVDKNSRSYTYRAKVSADALAIENNTAVTVRLPVSASSSATAITATAIQHDHLGQFIYLLEPDEATNAYRATRKNITLLTRQNGQALIKESLDPKQLVAGDGAFKLFPGLLVFTSAPKPQLQPQLEPQPSLAELKADSTEEAAL